MFLELGVQLENQTVMPFGWQGGIVRMEMAIAAASFGALAGS